ncbi:MAG: EamA family transporter [Deltaproteobacteria bacterium]|nr:EamA family transporter [Deltaproteobacteria bacterium]
MDAWYPYAVTALLLMGTQRFLYKVSAERKCNSAWTTFSFMGTVSVLSSLFFFFGGGPVSEVLFLVGIALLNSLSFLAATLTHMEALKHLPSSIAYPLIRLNGVVVVVFSFLFFRDRISLIQGIGILLAMAVIVILTGAFEEGEQAHGNRRRGLLLASISVLAGAVASISSKFAAMYTDKLAYIAVSYIAATLCSFAIRNRMQTGEANRNHRDALVIGGVMGVINFGGYFAFLKALSIGPLSLIVSITGMHFVIAVVLAMLIYRERLTPMRILGIVLTGVSLILMRGSSGS